MKPTTAFSDLAARVRAFIDRTSASKVQDGVGFPAGQSSEPDEREFNELALAAFELQFDHVPPYRRLCQSRGVGPAGAGSWRDLPTVPTSAFKDFEFTSIPPGARTRVFHSSGTSQQRPSRHFHRAESLTLYEASLLPWFQAHFLPEDGARPGTERSSTPAAAMIILTPSVDAAPHSSLAHMFDVVRKHCAPSTTVSCGVPAPGRAWTVDMPLVLQALAEAERNGHRVLLLGTAFSLAHLLEALEAGNRDFGFAPGSRVFETGGYKGLARALPKGELYSRVTRRLGIEPGFILNEYGMTELGSQAYDGVVGDPAMSDKRQPRAHRLPPWAKARIISPETGTDVGEGECGLLEVFDLANVWSVVGVQTEDLAVRRGGGFELVGRAAAAQARGCSLMHAAA